MENNPHSVSNNTDKTTIIGEISVKAYQATLLAANATLVFPAVIDAYNCCGIIPLKIGKVCL